MAERPLYAARPARGLGTEARDHAPALGMREVRRIQVAVDDRLPPGQRIAVELLAVLVFVGVLVAAWTAWIELAARVDAWWIEGLALVAGATGLAFLWTGLTGARPDWIDPRGPPAC